MNMQVNSYIGAMQKLIDTAEAENRNLTTFDQMKFDDLEIKINEKLDAEEANMHTQNANTATKKIGSPSLNLNKSSNYDLQKVLISASGNKPLDGIELECSQELIHSQPQRDFGGNHAVPLQEIFLNAKAKADLNARIKASGVITPSNLAPLATEEFRNELFDLIGTAISRQMISGKLGVTTIMTQEQTVKIPRMETPLSTAFVAIDTDLGDAGGSTFSTQSMTPKLVGGVAQLNYSSMLATQAGVNTTDFFAAELRRALINTLEDKFINGDNTGTPAEPDGLVNLVNSAVGSVSSSSAAVGEIDIIALEMEDYLQSVDDNGVRWLMAQEFVNQLKDYAAFTGSAGSVYQALQMNSNMVNNDILARGLNLPLTVNDYTCFMGDFSSVVSALWDGASVSVNPWDTDVFAKNAVKIRVHMMTDLQIVDPAKVLQFTATKV